MASHSLYIFYTTLLQQNPESKMAMKWCIKNNVIKDERNEKEKKMYEREERERYEKYKRYKKIRREKEKEKIDVAAIERERVRTKKKKKEMMIDSMRFKDMKISKK